MPMEIPDNLHPDLMPVVWLLGTWQGNGRGAYPGTDDFEFGQQAVFVHDGRPFLHYFSRTWIVDADNVKLAEGPLETGFLRAGKDGGFELVLTHHDGAVEVWYGRTDGARLELVTDLVARTETAPEVSAGKRLYGLVEGELMYAWDKAADGHEMQSYTWGRLQRA
jgi:hypothetical protein